MRTVLLLLAAVVVGSAIAESVRACDPIRIEMCRDLGYNVTSMPNFVGHELQQDAELQLQTFSPLIQYGCSSRLRFFLCSVYVPMCTEKIAVPIGPCRPLCESVRDRCQPVLQEFGLPWPAALNCTKFPPENNQVHMCMDGPQEEAVERDHSTFLNAHRRNQYPSRQRNSQPAKSQPSSSAPPIVEGPCSSLKFSRQYIYSNRTERCAHLCQADVLFRGEDKRFAGVWLAVWAMVCLASTLFTVCTFLMEPQRFRYPERPIIFLAAAYAAHSIGHVIRMTAGRDAVACLPDDDHGVKVLVQEGLDNSNCAIVFLLLYYFGEAAAVWWVILAFTWYLAAGRRWTHEAIERRSSYFHLAAWGIPAAETIGVLVMRAVDADELTGSCYVGNQNASTLLAFVLAPNFSYLLLGGSFLLAGFLKSKGRDGCQPVATTAAGAGGRAPSSTSSSLSGTTKADVLVNRIGIFAILYTLPATCVVAVQFYEYLYRDYWLASGSQSRPNLEAFMLKIFMALVVGITSGMWIWSTKTASSWQRLGRRLLRLPHRGKSQPPAYLIAQPVTKHLILIDKPGKRCFKGTLLAKPGGETAV